MKKGNKKLSILQVSRLFLQIVFFIFLPTLYIGALNGVKQIYLAMIHQSFSNALWPQVIEVIAIIPITIILGRFFCGWMCGFGSFSDFIYGIRSKLFKTKWRINERADAWMKYIKYVILGGLIAIVWSFNVSLFSTSSPWDAFGMLATVGKTPDFSYVVSNLTIGFAILVVIAVASLFIERFFCRYLCPMGAIFAIFSKLRIAKVKKPSAQCGKCRICTMNCAMGIPLYKMDVVNSVECINCMKCVSACPRSNTDFTIAKKDVRPLLAGVAVAATIAGMDYAGNFAVNAAGTTQIATSDQTGQATSTNKVYKDGTYKGSGSGYRGGTTTVSVTIKNDKITDISTVSNSDDAPFYNKAYSTIKQEIISKQSANVDAVSGATFSSNGIMGAVSDALNQAKISGKSSQNTVDSSPSTDGVTSSTEATTSTSSSSEAVSGVTSSSPSEDTSPASSTPKSAAISPASSTPKSAATPSTSSSSNSTATSSASTTPSVTTSDETTSSTSSSQEVSTKYKDGTYEGSGTGFRGGTTTVSVTIKGDKITNVSTVSYDDDTPFYNRAYNTIKQEIISNQSASVDAVSGATFSSHGIMGAVADALKSATA